MIATPVIEITYAIIIAMSLLTSIVAPPALKVLFFDRVPEPKEDMSLLTPVEETGHS